MMLRTAAGRLITTAMTLCTTDQGIVHTCDDVAHTYWTIAPRCHGLAGL
jgi:hypothetical protein